ncbi:MAG: alanine:cation symporter family protein [[Clostridium] leptum]
MNLAALLGMATVYAEALLAQKFKTVDADGQTVGGPACYGARRGPRLGKCGPVSPC